jgi:ABC-type nitrate/sulfonate/bicarbonate transport system substrate-binding protein
VPAAVSTPAKSRDASRGKPLRIGFLDLIDAAPLIVALERGFFADEGLNVSLERQLGWGGIRDRLTFGQLDAAHALLGMPLFSQLRQDRFLEPLVAVMNLGAGGNAITLGRRFVDAGVRSAATLADYLRATSPGGDRLVFAHVFSCSMHQYLLRDWLSAGGIDPDRDVSLRAFPPSQLPKHLSRGYLDGFCVGEPWNTIAQRQGAGRIVALTSEVLPAHPEKVLAVTRNWSRAHETVLVPLIRAVLRGCAFCDDEDNIGALVELLGRPEYLHADGNVIHDSLRLDHAAANRRGGAAPGTRATGRRARSFSPTATFPSKTHAAWMASQMIRWGQLPPETDVLAVARKCADATAYRVAAESLGVICPPDDFPPMSQRHGTYDPSGRAGPIITHVMEGASK